MVVATRLPTVLIQKGLASKVVLGAPVSRDTAALMQEKEASEELFMSLYNFCS